MSLKKKLRSIISFLFASTALVCVLNIIDFPYEFRFIERQYDYLFVTVLCILLPTTAFLWSIICIKQNWYKLTGIIAVLGLSLFCYFIGLFSYGDYQEIGASGVDFSFEEIERLNFENKSYVLYRTNGGATTAFGLVLRTEYPFLDMFKLIHRTYDKYEAYEGHLKPKNNEQFSLTIEPYSEGEKVEVLWFKI